MSVGVLSTEDGADLEDEKRGKGVLQRLSRSHRKQQTSACRAEETEQDSKESNLQSHHREESGVLEDLGATLRGTGVDLGAVDLKESLGVQVLSEELADTGLNTENGLGSGEGARGRTWLAGVRRSIHL